MAHIPEFLLERYVLDECDQDERGRVEEALASDPSVRARLEEIRLSNKEILLRHPASAVVPEIRARSGAARGVLSWGPLPRALAVAAMALLVFIPAAFLFRGGDRAKGDMKLFVFANRNSTAVGLTNGCTAGKGETLQIAYRVTGKKYGVIVSLDGRGTATLHFPAASGDGTALVPGRTTALPNAYRLDDAPGYEAFFLVVSARPLAPEQVMARVRALSGISASALIANPPVFDRSETRTVVVLKVSKDKE